MWVSLTLLPLCPWAWGEDPPAAPPPVEDSAEATPADAAPPVQVKEASARVDAYRDGWISVLAPGGAVDVGLPAGWSVQASWSADFVSGATPYVTTDAVSSATPFEEVRNDLSLGVAATPAPGWSARGSYAGGVEPDFASHVASLGASADAFEGMSTFSLDVRGRLETTGRVDDPTYAARAAASTVDLGWGWIVGRSTKAKLLVTGEWDACSDELGCVASPYRRVATADGLLSERHPDTRGRAAGALRLSQALGGSTALHGGYRYYADTWAISGHTLDLSLVQSLAGERLALRGTGRMARQGPASFWGPDYAAAPVWRTGDRDLGGLTSWQAGLALEGSLFGIGPFSRFSLSADLFRLWLRQDDFLDDWSHDAWLLGGGIDASF